MPADKEFNSEDKGELILYNSADGKLNVQVRLDKESVWLTQQDITDLYQTSKQNVSYHIKEIYADGELEEAATVKEFLTVRKEGEREVSRSLTFYNLEMIIALGYRIKSAIATQFRKWATERLKEYIVKGFTMDDERLKQGGDDKYFKELLQRIRDIRSSEKMLWRQVLDIFSTSIDYDKSSDTALMLFKVIQNKMHYAAHNHTAAEVVFFRADASKTNMGMTNFKGDTITRSESRIAKNYLNEDELRNLNAIVSAIFEFAEAQALRRKPMYMKDWAAKFDSLIALNDRSILQTMGKISHEDAVAKADIEYDKYKLRIAQEQSVAEKDFLEAAEKIKRLKSSKTKPSKKKKK